MGVSLEELPGVGPATLDKLKEAGYEDLLSLAVASPSDLADSVDIGVTTAQKIIDYREENSPFAVIEDIMNVSGIGPATFEDLKNLITV